MAAAPMLAIATATGRHQMRNGALPRRLLDQLLSALMMLAHVHERLKHRDLTIGKLKKLLGMATSSEKLRELAAALGAGLPRDGAKAEHGARAGNDAGPGSDGKKKPGFRRSPRRTRVEPRAPAPEVHHHSIQGLVRGDRCPACGCGRVYEHAPSEFTRVRGNARHTAER